jgi:hypothetical protein
MTGDTVRADGVAYVVVWSGQRSDFALLGDYVRPSSLAGVAGEPPPRRTRGRIDRLRQLRRKTLERARVEATRLWRER